MKRFMQVTSVIIILAVVMGVLSQPMPVKGFALSSTNALVSGASHPVLDKTSQPKSPTSGGPDPNHTIKPGSWRNLRPTESFLRDISMLPTSFNVDCNTGGKDQRSQGWIVGDDGVILSYCNGIWDQAITTESVPTNLYGVVAVTPTLAFATGADGTIEKYGWDTFSKDYTWLKFPITVSNQILYRISVMPDGANGYLAWAVGANDPTYNKATLIRGVITPNGQDPLGHPLYSYNWTNVTSIYPSLPAVDLWFDESSVSANDVWAVGGNATTGVAIHWDGNTWTPFSIGKGIIYGVYFNSSSNGWAVGVNGQIYHYSGNTWSAVTSPVSTILIDISFAPDGTGWISGVNGTLLKYNGSTWSKITDIRTDYWDYYAMDFTSGHGWMVAEDPYKKAALKFGSSTGMGGQILEFSDIDQAWVAVTIPTDNQLNQVKTLSDTNAWAVGSADANGATIIHWDGRHWQRWYQTDLSLPNSDLLTIDMLSATDGWAAGAPPQPNSPAVMLHWDGRRWAPPRFNSPINVNINSLKLVTVNDNGPQDFGWAVANNGDAVAKRDYTSGYTDYWDAVHIFGGLYFNLTSLSADCFGSCLPTELSAWAVGRDLLTTGYEYFLNYQLINGSYYWSPKQSPHKCPDVGGADDGPINTNLFGIDVKQNSDKTDWGFASGDYTGRATIYYYNGASWATLYCQFPGAASNNPTRFYSTNISPVTNNGWFGGYYTTSLSGVSAKVAFLAYEDSTGFGYFGWPYPINGRNIYPRPVTSISMSSDTMGWAVGEKEDAGKVGILYQYPYPNFTLYITPSIQAVQSGGHATYTVNVNSIAAGNMNVNLAVNGLPSGITPVISNPTIDPSTSATITLNIASNTPNGRYDFTIDGTSTVHSGNFDIPVDRSATATIVVTNHPITSVTPSQGPAATIVILSGQNLGSDPGVGKRSTLTNNVILAGVQMPDSAVLSWAPTQIQIKVPDNVTLFPLGPVKDKVLVTSSGTASNDNLDFLLQSHIESVDVAPSGTDNIISIHGTSFGPDPANRGTPAFRSTEFEHISLNLIKIDAPYVLSWSDNLIKLQLPNTYSYAGNMVTITANGYMSNVVTIGGSSQSVFLPMIRH